MKKLYQELKRQIQLADQKFSLVYANGVFMDCRAHYKISREITDSLDQCLDDRLITYDAWKYFMAKLDCIHVEHGFYRSSSSKAFGNKESRRYNGFYRF